MTQCKVAIETQDTKAKRIMIFLQPLIKDFPNPSAMFLPVLCPIAIDMVDRKKLNMSFSTAYTQSPPVSVQNLSLQYLLTLSMLLPNLYRMTRMIGAGNCLLSRFVLLIIGSTLSTKLFGSINTLTPAYPLVGSSFRSNLRSISFSIFLKVRMGLSLISHPAASYRQLIPIGDV